MRVYELPSGTWDVELDRNDSCGNSIDGMKIELMRVYDFDNKVESRSLEAMKLCYMKLKNHNKLKDPLSEEFITIFNNVKEKIHEKIRKTKIFSELSDMNDLNNAVKEIEQLRDEIWGLSNQGLNLAIRIIDALNDEEL